MATNTPRFATRAVVEAAYKQRHIESSLTHTIEITPPGEEETERYNYGIKRVLCRRVKVDNILDDSEATDPNVPPTCPICSACDPRFHGGQS